MGDYETPRDEQEWYRVNPRGEFYARRVALPSRWQGRLYPAGSYYIYLQTDRGGPGEFSEVLSEFEFHRRYAIVAVAEFVE
jgi:hypothetical protein